MTHEVKNKQGKKGGMSMSNTTAGAMGAVVGGMVGAAAGIALSDKQKRKMIMQKMEELKHYVSGALDEIQDMTQDSTDMITEKAMPQKSRKTTRSKSTGSKKQVN